MPLGQSEVEDSAKSPSAIRPSIAMPPAPMAWKNQYLITGGFEDFSGNTTACVVLPSMLAAIKGRFWVVFTGGFRYHSADSTGCIGEDVDG